jgi:hypothetical protein
MATIETQSVTDFFVRLGNDESLLADYMRDPRHGLESAHLDQASAATLLAGELDAVRSVVEGEVATDARLRRVITAPRMMTGGDEDEDEDGDDGDGDGDGDKHKPKPDEHDSRARQLVG